MDANFKNSVADSFSIYPIYADELSALHARIVRIYDTLPHDFKSSYARDITTITSKFTYERPLLVDYYKALEAFCAEREKQLDLLSSGITLDNSAVKIKNASIFLRYDKKIKTNYLIDKEPDIPEGILIQNDVPVLLEHNGSKLPYIYETKYYSTTKYGIRGKDLNQLIKYQKAIELGLIAGATIDIEGRISNKFIAWLGKNESRIKDVGIASTFRLPSGKPYIRYIKHPSVCIYSNDNINLPFENDKAYAARFNSLSDNDYINVCTLNITTDEIGDMPNNGTLLTTGRNGRLLLENPEDINDLDTYFYFSRKVKEIQDSKFESCMYSDVSFSI